MTGKKLRERTVRVRKMNKVLRELFPDPTIALNHGSTWELLVAVVLSAQCTDARVNLVTEKLFKKYRTIEEYARAPQREMERMVFQTGFYRNKAKNIRNAAKLVLSRFGGQVPRTMEELTVLPGVARKTANVVLSNAFNLHEGIAVDTHVRRFAIRFDLSDYRDPVRIERDLVKLMPKREWWGFNHRLVMYGREICPARKHACGDHPLTRVYPEAVRLWPKAR